MIKKNLFTAVKIIAFGVVPFAVEQAKKLTEEAIKNGENKK